MITILNSILIINIFSNERCCNCQSQYTAKEWQPLRRQTRQFKKEIQKNIFKLYEMNPKSSFGVNAYSIDPNISNII